MYMCYSDLLLIRKECCVQNAKYSMFMNSENSIIGTLRIFVIFLASSTACSYLEVFPERERNGSN